MGFGAGRFKPGARRGRPPRPAKVPGSESSANALGVPEGSPADFLPLQGVLSQIEDGEGRADVLGPLVHPEQEAIEFDLGTPIHAEWLEREDWWWALETKRRRDRLVALLSGEPSEVLARVKAEVTLCKYDHVHWFNNYAWMENPTLKASESHLRELPGVLWPKQEELVEFLMSGYRDAKPRLVGKGRELGVSWIACALIYNLFREESTFRAKLGSRKEQLVDGDLDSLFAKIKFLHERQPDFLKPPMVTRLLKLTNVATKGEITGEATNAGFGRGGRRGVILLDELAHVEAPLQSKIYVSIQRAMRSLWMVSTYNGPGNKFAELRSSLPEDCVMEIDWRTDPRRDEEWRLEQLEHMTEEEFEQEHGAKIVTLRAGKMWTPVKREILYHDETPEWRDRVQPNVKKLPLVGGWDFGSGASLLVCFLAVVEIRDGKPYIWIEHELVWQQTSWRTAAADVRELMAQYGSRHVHFGDPAGRSPESDQHSWETNLRAGGIPLMCLPDESNSRSGQEWAFKWVQSLFDERRLRVHARCNYLWTCLENWRRDTPEGMTLDVISRSYIPPRHDQYSHGGMALAYLVDGLLHSLGFLTNKNAITQAEAEERMGKSKHIPSERPIELQRRNEKALIQVLPPIETGSLMARVMGRGLMHPPGFDD